MVQSDMYLENFTQIKIYQKKRIFLNISSSRSMVFKEYRPNKPIEINNRVMLFLKKRTFLNKGKHKVITLYNE